MKLVDQKNLIASVDIRSGPGVFYEWQGRLFEGAQITILNRDEGWVQISSGETSGWIPDYPELFNGGVENESSENDFEERQRSIYSIFGEEDENGDYSDGYASPTQVAAAVRGFSRQYSVDRSGGSDPVIDLDPYRKVDPREYRDFKRERIGRWSRNRAQRRFAISNSDVPVVDHNYESVGWAAAKRLAAEGIVQNRDFQEYLYMLGLLVTESSHRYETPLNIYLLEKNGFAGYSTPAGVIFITNDAIELMQSEAELVFFIAHELAHILFRHGIREMEERDVHIRRDEAFEELRQLLGDEDDEYRRVSNELSEWADQVYEYLVSERLNEYEYEADYWALVYMYRLGYNPESALRLLQRIQIMEGDFEYEIGSLEWEGATLESRIEKIKNVFDRYPHLLEEGIINSEIFESKKRLLN